MVYSSPDLHFVRDIVKDLNLVSSPVELFVIVNEISIRSPCRHWSAVRILLFQPEWPKSMHDEMNEMNVRPIIIIWKFEIIPTIRLIPPANIIAFLVHIRRNTSRGFSSVLSSNYSTSSSALPCLRK